MHNYTEEMKSLPMRQKRRRIRKKFVALITRCACVVALMTIFSLLLGNAVRALRANEDHKRETLPEEIGLKGQNLDSKKISAGGFRAEKLSYRLRRSATILPDFFAPGGVTRNGVDEDSLRQWQGLQQFDGAFPLEEITADVMVTETSDHVTTKTNHTYATEYDRVTAYCTESIANGTTPTNQSTESGSHGEAATEEEHDVCSSERNSGLPALWAILYILVVLFLFIALAIICDDFFVPSLEVISERLNLSEDVAGATFMAAGSSAPELFTSVAGVGTGSDVGVGTIVGSAVFNLLVIIALTSALAGRVLQIDWRPLIRDSVFYGGSVMVFILFSWDGIFMWWESFLLLMLYVLYIVTMKFNQKLMDFLASIPCCGATTDGRVSPTFDSAQEELGGPTNQTNIPNDNTLKDNRSQQLDTTLPKTPGATVTIVSEQNGCGNGYRCCCCCCCRRMCGCRFTGEQTLTETTPTTKVSDSNKAGKGDCYDAPDPDLNEPILCEECKDAQYLEEDLTESGNLKTMEAAETKNSPNEDSGFSSSGRLAENDGPPPYECVRFSKDKKGSQTFPEDFKCFSDIRSQNKNSRRRTSSVHIFRRGSRKSWSSKRKSTSMILGLNESNNIGDMSEVPKEDKFTHEDDANIQQPNLAPPADEATSPSDPTAADSSGKVGTDNDAGAGGGNINGGGGGEEEDTLMVFPCLPPIKHPPPEKPDSSHCIPSAKYLGAWFVYALSFPWICAYTWTIPDCSKPESKKWYIMSFLISIIWIALISYVMVEVVDVIGCLMGIDSYTMGLVVIAVGTSVPDAISSVLVAKEGFGDMAVSNAIGSNVFDINLGLGLPFLLRSLITSEPVTLLSPIQNCLLENLTLSVRIVPHVKFGLILLLILFICLALFLIVRFRLNKTIGIIFVTIYVGFMIYAFVQEKSCHAFYC
uniref:Sodium/potassium/calcium exchanger 2 n=1 Tax=Phallusia mammillata TaxID=59560 RepID=A0A6F9DT22_9ASCI|nr:sodium/potassium/calcium exchanger 2 [Phallusia mammillata]